MHVHGECHCGALAWEADVDPATARTCNCTDCQRLSGSPYRVSVRAARDNFAIIRGEPRVYVKTGDSGNRRAQAFCGDCGTPVYATDAAGTQPFFLRTGAIRERRDLPPLSRMWCDSMIDWAQDLGALPCAAREL